MKSYNTGMRHTHYAHTPRVYFTENNDFIVWDADTDCRLNIIYSIDNPILLLNWYISVCNRHVGVCNVMLTVCTSHGHVYVCACTYDLLIQTSVCACVSAQASVFHTSFKHEKLLF